MLQQAGFDVKVVAFERDYHSGRMPTCPVTSLGKISHGRYLQRAFRMFGALPRLRRVLRSGQVAYASGQDMALFAIIAGIGLGVPVILEVGDIRHAQVARGWRGWIARTLDRWIVRSSSLLVVTARGFAEGHYEGRLGCRTPWLLLENKLDESPLREALSASASPAVRAPGAGSPLRIGYFGVIRCPWSWQVLRDAVQRSRGRIELVVAGLCMDPRDLPEEAAQLPGISYRGTYRSPQDLPALYGSVDMVWACYPGPEVRDQDWRWALRICRSNRFYESCFFRKPLIVMAESADGAEVERLGIGLTLDDQSDEGVWRSLSGITDRLLENWQNRMAELPKSVGVYTDEMDRLRAAVLKVRGGR